MKIKKFYFRGFTLLELIITIVIIAIIVTIGIPSFIETIKVKRIKEPTEKLYADLQFLRSEAIKKNQSGHIYFKKDGDKWCYGLKITNKDDEVCDCFKSLSSEEATSGVADLSSFCYVDSQKSGDKYLLKVVNITSDDFKGNIKIGGNSVPAVDDRYRFDPIRGLVYNKGLSQGFSVDIIYGDKSLRVVLSPLGRVRICSPEGKIGDYPKCL